MIASEVQLPYVVSVDPGTLVYALPSDLKVRVADELVLLLEDASSDTVVFEPALSTDYSVAITYQGAATITFFNNAQLLAGRKLVVDRRTPRTQPVNFKELDAFPGQASELMGDRVVSMIQELDARSGRALLARRGEAWPALPAKAAAAGHLLWLNEEEDGYDKMPVSAISALALDIALGEASYTYRVAQALADIEALAPLDVEIGLLAAIRNQIIAVAAALPLAASSIGVPSYDALRALTERGDGQIAFTAGREVIGDGAHGKWVYKAGATDADDDGTVLRPDDVDPSEPGRWFRQFKNRVCPRYWGAKVDGVTDDSAAYAAAAAKSGSVRVPDGVSFLSAEWEIQNKAINIKGGGRETSILKFSGTARGIYANNALEFSPVDVSEIGVTTTATTPAGVAIELVWPETFDGRKIHKGVISNCQFSGFVNTAQGWAKGVRYLNGCMVTIRDCGLLGKDTNGSGSALQSDKCQSSVGVEFAGGVYPVELRVHGNNIGCWDRGVLATGSPEGVYVHENVFGQCRIGVDAEPTTFSSGIGGGSASFRPLLNVGDNHFAVYETAVRSSGMVQSYIRHNMCYMDNGGSQDATMIIVANGGDVSIEENKIYFFGSVWRGDGIVVENTGTGSNELINNTVVSETADGAILRAKRAIWIKSDAGPVWLKGNKALGAYTVDSIDIDNTQTALGMRGALVYLNAASVAIPNSTNTDIAFDSEQDDTDGFYTVGASATRITIPPNRGIRRVRLKAQITIQGNGTGIRDFAIRKNGSNSYIGRGLNGRGAMDANGATYLLETAIIRVTDNDYFTVNFFHNSGGDLNVQGNQQSWFQIEVIE